MFIFNISLHLQTSDFRGFDLSDRMTVCQNKRQNRMTLGLFLAFVFTRLQIWKKENKLWVIHYPVWKDIFSVKLRHVSVFFDIQTLILGSDEWEGIFLSDFFFLNRTQRQSSISEFSFYWKWTKAARCDLSDCFWERSRVLFAEIMIVIQFPGPLSKTEKVV